jgi:hypothetical protein
MLKFLTGKEQVWKFIFQSGIYTCERVITKCTTATVAVVDPASLGDLTHTCNYFSLSNEAKASAATVTEAGFFYTLCQCTLVSKHHLQ